MAWGMLGVNAQITFGRFRLDLLGRRLLHDGDPVALEPKAVEVLVLLASAPGRAFTRDEILDSVWGHRHVTPGVLNRVMTLLRHALGEDAQRPCLLHTLHGVGYRFDLPEAPAAMPAPPAAPAAMPAPAVSALRPVRRRWHLHVGLGLLVLAGLGGGWWWQVHRANATDAAAFSAVANASPAAAPRLIVLPLQPIGNLRSTRDIAAGLGDELITELARIRGLRVIARESTGLATAGPRDLNRIVRDLKVTHALEGSLSQSGEQLRMHLRLLDVRDGVAIWAQDYDREAADVLALQQDVARAVAKALTLELGLVAQTPRGGDAEFLRRFYAMRSALVSPDARRRVPIESIEMELRALLRERPEDARVRATLASALDARASFSPPLAQVLRAEAAKEAAVALEADPTLPDALRVQASAAYREARWEDCFRLLELADRYGPNESGPRARYAMLWANLGYLDRAEASMREVLRSDPLNPSWRFVLARILDTRGKHDEAYRTLPRTSATHGPYALIFNAIWRGDLDQAAALADTMEQNNTRGDAYVHEFKPSYVAAVAALRDPSRWPDARKEFEDSERRTGLMNFLRVFDPEHPPALLVDGLDTTRRRAYSSWDLLMWTHDLGRIRRDPAFDAYLRRSGILAYWHRHGFPSQCRPQGDGATCD